MAPLVLMLHNIGQASAEKGDESQHKQGQGMCQKSATSATSASRLQYSCLQSEHCGMATLNGYVVHTDGVFNQLARTHVR